jgi:hypothetical protein
VWVLKPNGTTGGAGVTGHFSRIATGVPDPY